MLCVVLVVPGTTVLYNHGLLFFMELRKAVNDDLLEIMEMDKKTLLYDASLCGIVPENIEKNHPTLFEKALDRFEGEIWVADVEGVLAGFIWIIKSVDYFSGHPIGFLLKAYVKEEYRNQGIATRLVQKGEEFCKKYDLEALELNVAKNNLISVHVCEKCGFEVTRYRMRKSL